jgi:hypothetical protein
VLTGQISEEESKTGGRGTANGSCFTGSLD